MSLTSTATSGGKKIVGIALGLLTVAALAFAIGYGFNKGKENS